MPLVNTPKDENFQLLHLDIEATHLKALFVLDYLDYKRSVHAQYTLLSKPYIRMSELLENSMSCIAPTKVNETLFPYQKYSNVTVDLGLLEFNIPERHALLRDHVKTYKRSELPVGCRGDLFSLFVFIPTFGNYQTRDICASNIRKNTSPCNSCDTRVMCDIDSVTCGVLFHLTSTAAIRIDMEDIYVGFDDRYEIPNFLRSISNIFTAQRIVRSMNISSLGVEISLDNVITLYKVEESDTIIDISNIVFQATCQPNTYNPSESRHSEDAVKAAKKEMPLWRETHLLSIPTKNAHAITDNNSSNKKLSLSTRTNIPYSDGNTVHSVQQSVMNNFYMIPVYSDSKMFDTYENRGSHLWEIF